MKSKATKLIDPNAQPLLRINLLGPIEIRTEGGEAIELPRKVRTMFAYLVTRRGTSVPRQTLIGLFWGDRAEEQARASLPQALNILRTSLGNTADSLIGSTSESISIRDGTVLTDLDELEQSTATLVAGNTDHPVKFGRFEFLEELSISEAGFEDWVCEERERGHARLVDQLKQLSAFEEAAGHYDSAAGYVASWLQLAPFDEEAHRQMMRLHLARGRSDAAIRQFDVRRQSIWNRMCSIIREHPVDLRATVTLLPVL